MTQLTIYPEDNPSRVLLDTKDGNEIVRSLAEIGVTFERWDASQTLSGIPRGIGLPACSQNFPAAAGRALPRRP